jgi:hypothetical protein
VTCAVYACEHGLLEEEGWKRFRGIAKREKKIIREENLLQMMLWKTVHFALFLVKISINFSPGYSTVFFFYHSVHLYFTIISKFYYKNFKIFVQCFNE